MKNIGTSFLLILFCSTGFAQARPDFKTELKKLTDDLVLQLKSQGNRKIAVANFNDLQGNVTELGRYLAQQVSVNLIRSQMNVVDRSRVDVLMEENKMTAKGLLDPRNQTKLGQMAGIEIIITGTTSPFDNTVELTVSAIDISKGSACAATDGTISRTEAINSLLRSQVGSGTSSNSSVNNSPYVSQAPGEGQDPSLALMGDREFSLPKNQCIKGNYVYGQVYFENTLKEDLVLYQTKGWEGNINEVKIAAGTKNYSQLLFTGYNKGGEIPSSEYVFLFHTAEAEENQRRYGSMSVVVSGCKVKVHVINSNRIFLKRQR